MPSVEWQHNGNYRRCDSSDPVIVARFILEQITNASPGMSSDHTTMQILPLYVRDPLTGRPVPDWPGMRAKFAISSREDLSRLAQYIMAWQVERDRPLTGMEEENAQPVPPPPADANPDPTLFS